MRLITRQIHRAFPELDSYDDEQCARFIKAARSGASVWFLHTTAILAVTLPLLFVGIGLSAWASDKLRIYSFTTQSFELWLGIALWMLATVLFLGFGLVAGYLTRDLLLRRRLRYILQTRGGCPGCGYSVIGLAVTTKDNGATSVRCPECGSEVEVDPSLSELVREGGNWSGDSEGLRTAGAVGGVGATGRVFVGGVRVDLRVFWTARRKKIAKRVAIIFAIVVFGGGGLVAGINEIYIRWQAGKAQKALDKAQADYLALAEKGYAAAGMQPLGAGGAGPSVWEQFDEVSTRMNAVDGPAWRDAYVADTSNPYPDFGSIANPQASMRDSPTPEVVAKQQAAIDLARSVIPLYEKAGVFESIQKVGGNPNARLPDAMLSVDLSRANFSIIGRQREVCRVLGGRMALAAEAGNRAVFLESLDAIMVMARAGQAQPLRIALFTGVAYESLALEHLRVMLMRGQINAAWIPEIQEIIQRRRLPLAFDHSMEGERLIATGAIAKLFADPGNVRLGKYSKGFQRALPTTGWGAVAVSLRDARLGTLDDNLKAADALFANALPTANAEAWQRGTMASWGVAPTDLTLVNAMVTVSRAETLIDTITANRRGLDTWLALERFKVNTGAYPASLAELIPKHLPAFPLDPWTAKSIQYRRFATSEDPDARPFVLYFVGPDEIDDGGTGATKGQSFWSQTKDHVVNDPNR